MSVTRSMAIKMLAEKFINEDLNYEIVLNDMNNKELQDCMNCLIGNEYRISNE